MLKTTQFLLLIFVSSVALHASTYIKDYTYRANELDNENTARSIALERVKTNLLEEIGVYVRSTATGITRESSGTFSDEFVREVYAVTAGITQTMVLDEKWDGATFYIKAQIAVDEKQFADNFKRAIDDTGLKLDLQASRREAEQALAEVEQLKHELEKARAESSGLRERYVTTANKIGSEQFYQKAVYSNVVGNTQETQALASQAVQLNPGNTRAKKLMKDLEWIFSEERALQMFDKALQLGYSHAYDGPRFVAPIVFHTATYSYGYLPTFLVAQFWKSPKESNRIATYSGLGLYGLLMAIELLSEGRAEEEVRKQFSGDTYLGGIGKFLDSYPAQLIANTTIFGLIGASIGGGVSLANQDYGSSTVDLAKYQTTGAIIGGSLGLLYTVLFIRDIETVRDKYKDKLEEYRRRKSIGLWPRIGIEENRLAVGLTLRVGLN